MLYMKCMNNSVWMNYCLLESTLHKRIKEMKAIKVGYVNHLQGDNRLVYRQVNVNNDSNIEGNKKLAHYS